MDCDTVYPSCQAILQASLAEGDGLYIIDPFGGAPFEVYCDMTTDGAIDPSCEAYRRPAQDSYSYNGATGNGVYLIDPDGTGPIAAFEVFCQMEADQGGWQRVFEWNREKDPLVHTLASLQSATTDEVDVLVQGGADVSTMGDLQDQPDHVQWSDFDRSYDALSYMLDVGDLAREEVMVDLRYHGESMEDSGVWFYVKGNIVTLNLACSDDTPVVDFSTDERALIPYSCPTASIRTWDWDDTFVVDLNEQAQSVHIRSLHHDFNYDDESRLYRFDVYMR